MRLFIAIDLPDDIKDYIVTLQRDLKKKNFFEGKFPSAENLHITLKFIGSSSKRKLGAIQKCLNACIFESFLICLDKIELIPADNPALVWVSLESGAIESAVEQLDKALEGVVKIEDRKFIGHITLARIKKIYDLPALKRYTKQQRIETKCFSPKDFVLKNSILSSNGPQYTNISRYKLTDGSL